MSPLAYSKNSIPALKTSKSATPSVSNFNLYSSVELRHNIDTYYDKKNFLEKQSPSLQARFQIGSLFYSDSLDIYATLGVIKYTETQQIVQRRPRIQGDIYPFKNEYFILRQYNLLKLPHHEESQSDNEDETSEDSANLDSSGDKDGTTYILGIEPSLFFKQNLMGNNFNFRFNTNLWTKFFSQKQFLDDNEDALEDGFSLTESQETLITDKEDYVQRLWSQQSIGWDYQHDLLQPVIFSVYGYFRSFYYPKYFFENDQLKYRYEVDRNSYYRLRLKLQISENSFLINDFYHFFSGLFEKKIYENQKRFRNILRITYKM